MTSMRSHPPERDPGHALSQPTPDQLFLDLDVAGAESREMAKAEAHKVAKAHRSPGGWPFMPDDIAPFAWWRTLPPELLRTTEQVRLRSLLDEVALPHDRSWTTALHSELPSAVAIMRGQMPDCKITLAVDLAMSTLLLAALGGNAVAAVVLSCALTHAALDHPFGRDLAVSWLRPDAWGNASEDEV